MTPFMSLLLPIVVAAVAVFVLSMIIHMTPWHKSDYIRLPDEDGVMKALRPFNIPPNDYVLPHPGSAEYMKSPEYDARRDPGPVMIVRKWFTTFKTASDSLLYALATGWIFSMMWPKM